MRRKINPKYQRDDEHVRPAEPAGKPARKGWLRTWLRRHRWQLVPVEVAAGAYLVAGMTSVWPTGAYTTLGVAAAAGLALVQRVATPAERLYGRVVIAGTSAWVVVADLVGVANWTIALLWASCLWTGGAPWWSSHRVRGRIRVDALVEAWPEWTARAQMPGVRIVSAQAGRVHDRLRLELQRGRQSARHLVEHLEALASVRGIPMWRLRADTQITRSDPGLVDLLITHTDPWRDQHGQPVELPHPSGEDLEAWCQPASVCDPVPYGVQADGAPASVALRNERGGRLIALASKKGGGKTVALHDLLAGLCRMSDVDIAVVDCKERGKASAPWAPRLARRATTPAEAIDLLRWAEQENGRRGAESPDPVLVPTAQRRALVVVVDEYGALVLTDSRVAELVERLARTIRSASGGLIVADQRPDHTTWTGALRGQIDEVIVGVLENRRDATAILPTREGIDVTEFELPGQMVQQAGKTGRQVEARTWHLEDPVDIAAIVHGCRDRWPDQDDTNTSRSSLEDTMELPRGTRAAAVRQQIVQALDDIAAQDHSGIPDLSAEELRRRGQAAPILPATPDEQALDERICAAIAAASPDGIAMADLVDRVAAPRSTVQVRASTLRRQGRVHTDPPRGRHARWHITMSDRPAMSNA